jgi:SEC-C motif
MIRWEKKSKVGRNEPCPCGSGQKFKKCHGRERHTNFSTPRILQDLQAVEIRERQRVKQQGLGRPIISAPIGGRRAIAVGDHLYRTKAKTFQEFLWEYMKSIFGSEWGNAELEKPADKRHPLLNWYQEAAKYINAHIVERGKVQTMPSIGVVSAYLQLAYSLYLIAHNQNLEERLIRRLKQPDQFLPAYYEASVFGALIRAGFELEFEDETDSSTTHCEVAATFRKSGRKFSVEAKMRQASTASLDIGRQIKKALRKKAIHARIVFAEINIPEVPDSNQQVESLRKILEDIRKRESETLNAAEPLPSAYVVVTNHPFLYFPDKSVKHWAIAEGFRVPDFGWRASFGSLKEALAAREKHQEMFALRKSWEENSEIPTTFDGEIPEFAFGNGPPRLLVGQDYNIPDNEGGNVVGTLMQGIVMPSKKECFGFYRTKEGKNIIATCPLTDSELAAYERHPDTFFGVPQRPQKGARDALELYDFFYDGHKSASKDNLLKLLDGASDMEELKKLSREDLLQTYCERLTIGFFQMPASVQQMQKKA